jgi:hypothetical protein
MTSVLAFNCPQTLKFRTHFIDFGGAENILNDKITFVIELLAQRRRKISVGNSEKGEGLFCVHEINPPSFAAERCC